MARISFILVSIALATTGCDMLATDDQESIPTEEPTPTLPEPEPEPELVRADGTYDVVTTFDLTLDVLLPEQALGAVTVLADFREDPAATLFDLLDDAGVPLVGDLMDALPGTLEDKLMGWINEYMEEALFQDTPVMEIIDEVLNVSHTSLTNFEMVSELELGEPDSDGQMSIAHRIRGVRFSKLGLEGSIDVPSLGPLTNTEATAWLEREDVSADAQLVLGEHGFSLPYGEYALSAVEAIMQERYGMSIRESLGAAVDCSALAATVADKCVLGLCVGHEDDLLSLCEQGLDLAVSELRNKFEEYRFDAMNLASGEAQMWDALESVDTTDGRVDHLRGGLWQASIDLSMGLREISATFEGTRR